MLTSKIKYYLIFFVSLFILPSLVSASLSPTTEFYVNDYANILSDETEKYIIEKSNELNMIDGTQIVVVTIPSLEGEVLEEYSLNLAREWGIGFESEDNGLLLLLSLEDRLFRVEVGYGLEGILTDGKTGRFQDEYMIPYFKDDKWDEGMINGYNAFFEEIVTLNNLNIEYNEPIGNEPYESDPVGSLILGLSVVGSVVLGIFLGKELSIKQRYAYANGVHRNNPLLNRMLDKYKNVPNYQDKKINKNKVFIIILIIIALAVLGIMFNGIFTIFINAICTYMGAVPQYPSVVLSAGSSSGSSIGRGSSGGGSSFGGGSSGGGGSFGGGGSSRGF